MAFLHGIRDAGGQFDAVAFPEKAGNIGQDHQLLLGDDLAFGDDVAQRFIVAEQAEFPGGERLGTGKTNAQRTVFAGGELRQPEGRFLEVGANVYGFVGRHTSRFFYRGGGGGTLPAALASISATSSSAASKR